MKIIAFKKPILIYMTTLFLAGCANNPSIGTTNNILPVPDGTINICKTSIANPVSCAANLDKLWVMNPPPNKIWSISFPVSHSKTAIYPTLCSYMYLSGKPGATLLFETQVPYGDNPYSVQVFNIHNNGFGTIYYKSVGDIPDLDDNNHQSFIIAKLEPGQKSKVNTLFIACFQIIPNTK